MKKILSIALALFTMAVFCMSAFADDGIMPCRYEPCPRCGNPLFEYTTYDPWIDAGQIRACPDRGTGYYDMLQTRSVRTYWKCGTSTCPRTNECVITQTRWHCI